MYIYKFRITFEEVEDFLHDIEILSNQTFEHLHYFITENFDLHKGELASFFLCDQRWKKKHELTLIDMGEEIIEDELDDDDDDDFKSKNKILPRSTMQDEAISFYIDDPRQKLLYEYDYANPMVFHIELVKTSLSTPGVEYPRTVHMSGKLPENKNINFPIIGEIEGDLTNMLNDNDEDADYVDDLYGDDYDDIDDIADDIIDDDSGII